MTNIVVTVQEAILDEIKGRKLSVANLGQPEQSLGSETSVKGHRLAVTKPPERF